MTRTKGIAILCVALTALVACSAGTTVVARNISAAGAVVPGPSQTAPVLECLKGAGYKILEVLGESRAPQAIAREIEKLLQRNFGGNEAGTVRA